MNIKEGDMDMLLPGRSYNLFDDFFNNDFWTSDFPALKAAPSMKTDIKEVEGNYELSVELPGFNKEDISAQLRNGYLTISAKHEENNDKKDNNQRKKTDNYETAYASILKNYKA